MSFRELRNFSEMLRGLGFPRMVSIDNFRQPNFPLVAETLLWLARRFDPQATLPEDIETESDRVFFIKAMAQFMATETHVRLNTKRLYGADGYAVKELLKIASLLYNASRFQEGDSTQSGKPPVTLTDFDIDQQLGELKQTRMLAGEITSRGARLYELLEDEVELRELRTEVLSKGVDIEDMERGVRQSIAAVKSQIQRIHTLMDNVASDEANLEAKMEKKQLELERNKKRLRSLQSVRPAFMDEYEKLEQELETVYEDYIERFRNLSYLEDQLEQYNGTEHDKEAATEAQLKRMQVRMQEDERRMIRGDDEDFGDLEEDMGDEESDLDDNELEDERRPAAIGDMRGDDLGDELSDDLLDDDEEGTDELLDGSEETLGSEEITETDAPTPDRDNAMNVMGGADEDDDDF